MQRQVITVCSDDSLDELINVEVGRLPVVDNGRLVGIVTRSDLAKAYYSSAQELERSLDTIIESVHNAMITIDESAQVQIFNMAAQKLFWIKREEIIGQPITRFMSDSTLLNIVKTGSKKVKKTST